MKRSNRLATFGVALVCMAVGVAIMVTTDIVAQPPRPQQWKKVEEAISKGLPKTAIQELEPIIASALRDKAYPEAIKAIGKKIALEGNIQGNKPEEKILRMQAAIATVPAEMVPRRPVRSLASSSACSWRSSAPGSTPSWAEMTLRAWP